MKKTIIFILISIFLYGSKGFAHDIGDAHDDIWHNQMEITNLSIEKNGSKIQNYKTKKNFLNEKKRYSQILEKNYQTIVSNFDEIKKQKVLNKIESSLEDYEQNDEIDEEKREKFLSLLHALRELIL